MLIFIISIFAFLLLIQILYLVVILSRFLLERVSVNHPNIKNKGVSIIVCAWNELENLQELIPILEAQQYDDFEIVIVDDRSTDGTDDYLKHNYLDRPNIKIVTISETPEHLASKKYALSLGIKVATKEVVLLTDADCRPDSENWVSSMISQLSYQKQFVLGFSPYFKEPGLLNAFIRFETFFTAWQYFSFALLGMPYMGVGRNLMYKRKLFFEKLGFRNHQKITGGDDDLFVNENANSKNTGICFNNESFTFSEPKHSFKDWIIQKKRHLHIGKRYKQKHKILLGLFSISHIGVWLILPLVLLLPLKWQLIIGACYLFRLLLFWIMGAIANHKLGRQVTWYSLPFFDFLLAVYFGTMGWFAVLNFKKISWR